MKDESNPTAPITAKRFDILVHSANKLLDPNYASWITSKKALHFTFVSTTQNPKNAISRLERIGIKKNAYIIYKNHRIDDADIVSGYMELPKAVTMAEVTNIGKGNFTFSVRIKSRSDVRKSYQSEFSVEILGKNGNKQWGTNIMEAVCSSFHERRNAKDPHASSLAFNGGSFKKYHG